MLEVDLRYKKSQPLPVKRVLNGTAISRQLNAEGRMLKAGNGVTLIELMIAVTIMSIAILGIVFGFSKLGAGLILSKNKSAASNLAQEKIESLKNISYYRLMVSTPGATATHPLGFLYDTNYYPSETIRVGNLNYIRYTYIKKKTESGGLLIDLAWDSVDSGVKEIIVNVVWDEGGDTKKIALNNFRNNPTRAGLLGTLNGVIKDAADASALSNCQVYLQDAAGKTQAWNTTTGGAGDYSLQVPTGTWQVRVVRSGYFTAVSSQVTLISGGAQSLSPTLSKMGTASITGWVARGDGLKIAGVAASSATYEFVELFNPTTWTITIGSGTVFGAVTDYYHIHYVYMPGDAKEELSLYYRTNSIAPGQYYLIANTQTVYVNGATPVLADAYYVIGGTMVSRIANDTGGGIGLTLARYTVSDSPYEVWVDCVAWGISGGNPSDNPPLSCVEGTNINSKLMDGYILKRLSSREGTAYDPANDASYPGAGWDNNRNGPSGTTGDFDNQTLSIYGNAWNTETAGTPVTTRHGSPMAGAIVSGSDGLSSAMTAYAEDMDAGAPVVGGPARFWLNNVATGTWTVAIASGNYAQFTTVDVTAVNTTYYIRHWGSQAASNTEDGTYWTRLSSANSNGFVSGRVTQGGTGLGSISVTAAAGGSATTDSNGYYRFSASSGTYTVTANEGNANASYTVGTTTGVNVETGKIISGIDFSLSAGGQVSGKVTTNGTDALPGIVVGAYTGGAGTTLIDSVVTDSAGNYQIKNLSANTYQIQPVLDTGESITTPAAGYETVVIVAGSNFTSKDFQVTSGFGKIVGSCTDNSNAITTGVLVYASTSSIPAGNPPSLTYSAVAGVTRYMAISGSDGKYALNIRKPTSGTVTYYLYGYYTTQDANGATATTRKDSTMAYASSDNERTWSPAWP